MRIPPSHPAFVGAELLRTVFPLGDCATAIHADRLFGQFGISQTIAPAECFDCIDGYAGLRRDISIAKPGILTVSQTRKDQEYPASPADLRNTIQSIG